MSHKLISVAIFLVAIVSSSDVPGQQIKQGVWKLDNFIDEFGDKTRDRFISLWFAGTFSNTATTASKLNGYVQISETEGINISLWEYGSQIVKGYKSDGQLYHLYVKAKKKKYSFLGKLIRGSSRIKLISPYSRGGDFSLPSRFIVLLRKHSHLKVYVSDGDTNSYRFDILSTDFRKKYKQLDVLKKVFNIKY